MRSGARSRASPEWSKSTTSTSGRSRRAARHGYAPPVSKRRLDSLLVERGLFDNRSRAAAAVLAGAVRIGADGRSAAKPGEMVRDDVELAVHEAPPFVSRGGLKLANALDRLG